MGQSVRILIAEDDTVSRFLLRTILERNGHEVVETRDGGEAWEVLRLSTAPELAILDWMMPVMDGPDVCRLVRRIDLDMQPYIILLTALSDKRRVVEGLDAGADDYLTKPFESAELLARIGVGQRLLCLRERLTKEASVDELTGLPNRRAGLRTLERELDRARREGSGLGVALIDVDHFKRVNDTHGHPVGDEVLEKLARRLESAVRPYDHIIRLGGEEFMAVCPGASRGAPWERLRSVVAGTPFSTAAGGLDVTVSIGFVTGSGDMTADALIELADRALYRAKAGGRNRTEFARPPVATAEPVESTDGPRGTN